MLVLAGCGGDAESRAIGSYEPPAETRQVFEGNYGPIAQYLVDHSDAPAPTGDDGAAPSES
ncbi:MAG: hypothetical protein IAG13_10740, partial [Deltaproteobacteria bacterium]|nr:hypothetical protein [Nannocystaceae bacterium]